MDQKGRNQDNEEIPGSRQSMQGCILTYSPLALKGGGLSAPGDIEGLNFCIRSTPLWELSYKHNLYPEKQVYSIHEKRNAEAFVSAWLYFTAASESCTIKNTASTLRSVRKCLYQLNLSALSFYHHSKGQVTSLVCIPVRDFFVKDCAPLWVTGRALCWTKTMNPGKTNM